MSDKELQALVRRTQQRVERTFTVQKCVEAQLRALSTEQLRNIQEMLGSHALVAYEDFRVQYPVMLETFQELMKPGCLDRLLGERLSTELLEFGDDDDCFDDDEF